MGEPSMEHESFRFTERIDHAMQETHEERGVEVHRAGGIEEEHKPQRPDLAAAPREIHQRAAMRYISVNCVPQIETPSAPTHTLASHQSRPHYARKPRRERVRLRDIGRLDNMAQIHACEVFAARGAFTLAAAITGIVSVVVAALHMIEETRCSYPPSHILEDRKSTRLNSSHLGISYAVFCLKKKHT